VETRCCGSRPENKLDHEGYSTNGNISGHASQAEGPRPQAGYAQAVGPHPSASVGGPPPEPTGRKRALLVGCNYPGSQAELSGCVNDVLRMSSMLRTRYSFSPYEMRILTDDGHSPHGYSTRANIAEGMRWLVEGAQPGDALFFHYSGHGGQQEDPNYAEEDGYDETILPTDFQHAGMIVDDEIFDTIIAPLQSGTKLTAVMDCCHSGTGLDLPFIWQHGQWIEEDNPCHSAGDVILISGCLDEQTSADATGHRGEAAGAMTTALCDSLEEHAPGSAPACGQLLEAMRSKLLQRGFDQIPNLTSSQRFNTLERGFSVCEGFLSNTNAILGRQLRKTKHPKMDFGGGLGDLLSMSATAMAFAPMVTGLFGGHHPETVSPAPAPVSAEGGHPFDTAESAPLTSFGTSVSGPGGAYDGDSDGGDSGWDDGDADDDFGDAGWDD